MRYLLALTIMLFSTLLLADSDQDLENYFTNIESEIVYGPGTVLIEDAATFQLAYGQAFLNKKHIEDISRLMGTEPEKNVAGWIIPGTPDETSTESGWDVIKVEYADSGHISDDVDWDYDRIMKYLTDDQSERGNEVLGWVEKPNYSQASHNLSWSFNINTFEDENYDVYQNIVLGRSDIMGFSIIAPSINRSNNLVMIHNLLDSASFNPRHQYDDYQAGIDKDSTLGLAALVGGAAAKKLGLFAVILALLAKFGKFIALAIGGLAVLLKLKKKNT